MKRFLFAITLLVTFNSLIMSQTQTKTEKEYVVVIHTDMGDITVKLYNETPLHRDNFIKLVNEGYYNGSIFHRVIRDFMIQGGGGTTGMEDPGYTVPAEIVSPFYHKKGALSAARKPDQVNPKKESSGSQFYIVQGRQFSKQELDVMTQRVGKNFTPEQIETYATLGGTPHLDGDYTVFGEVISGLEVVDKIAAVQTAQGDRPVKEIKMRMNLLK
ncbi:MAG: peptidylprolyl isomerase [Bacteroidales bacterium]|nr:peptidylprolyl isomerase [Bacteroidales bacterium]